MDAAKMEKQAKRKVMMQLHIVSGSFCPQAGDDAAGAGGGCPMDATVWRRLPGDMVWRVLGFLPPAKRFQLHCVSRGWRLMLTSPHFRDTYAIAHGAATQQQRSSPVVACVTPYASDAAHQLLHTRRSKAKVVDVDLSSFVPSWFWEPHTDSARNRYEAYRPYSLVGAGDGLVCIRNDTCQSCRGGDPEMLKAAPRYCVLNPVTRTCVVLPPAPFGKPMMFRPVHWLHPSATVVSMCRWSSHEATATPRYNNLYVNYDEATCCEVATCDLAAAAAAGGPRWTVLHSRVDPPQQLDRHMRPPLMEHCGGETFSYLAGRVHVLAPAPALPETAGAAKRRRLEEGCGAGAGHRMLVEAADAVAGPSVALLGLDPAAVVYGHNDLGVELVAHRGAIFLVARLMRPPGGARGTCTPHPALVAGVWRLARRTMAWEPVSLLDTVQAKRLVQQSSESCGWSLEGGATLFGAFVVRDLLSCELGFGVDECPCRFTNCVVGLDVDAGKWELVVLHHHHEEHKWRPDSRKCGNMVDLNPDLFLS